MIGLCFLSNGQIILAYEINRIMFYVFNLIYYL